MAASYPASAKTFTQLVDGTSKVEAVNANSAYDEIEAMQSYVGVPGVAASNSDSIISALQDYIKGCEVVYDSTTQLTVKAGELAIVTGAEIRFRRNTSDTTVTWADIDTGAEASDTTYYVYAVADTAATTFTVTISTNSSAPTGATNYRLLGSFYNDGSSDIKGIISDHFVPSSEQVCKGWVRFDGTGTVALISGGGDSYNVSSLTDNGTGDYTVTWNTDFGNADYAVVSSTVATGGGSIAYNASPKTFAVGSVVIETKANDSTSLSDRDDISVIAFGER